MERQYAMVCRGQVLCDWWGTPVIHNYTGEMPEVAPKYPPGSKWLPIVNEDSEPFDPERHWRETPQLIVRGDVVVRVYSVVPRTDIFPHSLEPSA